MNLYELTTAKLDQYTKAADADYEKAKAAGDYKKSLKRASGMMKASGKKIDNDVKALQKARGVAEEKAGWSIKGSPKPAPKAPTPHWRLNKDGTATDLNTGITYNRDGSVVKTEEDVEEGFVFLSPKEKGSIQNIVSQISDIPGMWDHAAQTFTDSGMGRLKAALKDNSKYIKYAVNLTADDFEAESVEEAKQRLDPKCWSGYKKQGTKMKGGVRVNNCVKIGEGWEDIMTEAVTKLFKGK